MRPHQIIANVTQSGKVALQQQVRASIGTSGVATSTNAFAASNYNFYMSGLLPATPDLPDSTNLAYFYRDIYLHDNVAGSCVDIQSVFPFSDWELRGLEDHDLKVFNEALDRLNLRELFPQLSTAYLTDGFYAGSLVYEARAKNFMDILTHDALQCAVTPSSFNNVDPTVRVSTSGSTQRFLSQDTDFARRYIASMPQSFVQLLREGQFTLDPLSTLFIGRRSLTDRAYVSYLHRVLPMYLIEKTLFRGTLTEAQRRQRAMSHVTAGDDLWTPTSEELMTLIQQFQMAESDPMGGWVSTRNAVQISDIRPAGDFWKWMDAYDTMVPYKLRALGVSEALLSGDSSYAAAESAYSTFLETVNGYRTHLTHSVFNKKIFPLIAVANGMFKDSKKQVKTVEQLMFNLNHKATLKLPTLHWHKDLTAKAEDNTMELLEKLQEKDVPIPLKTWLAATGIDKETLLRDAREDKELRALLTKYQTGANESQHEDAAGLDDDEFDDVAAGEEDAPQLTSASTRLAMSRNRKAILNRKFEPGELVATTRTGKPKVVYNQAGKIKDQHWNIAKIAAKAESDPNYRAEIKNRNLRAFGKTRIDI